MIRKLHIWTALLYAFFTTNLLAFVTEMYFNHILIGKIEKDSPKWQPYNKDIFEELFSL